MPSESLTEEYNYEPLAHTLMNPGGDTPRDLVDALFVITAMADEEGHDAIIEAAQACEIDLGLSGDATPIETALALWLLDKPLLQQLHSEHFATKDRNFTFYRTRKTPVPQFEVPNEETRQKICAELDKYFESKGRGVGSRMHFFSSPEEDAVWVLLQHGDTCRREGVFDKGSPSSVFFRPEKYDVLIYNKKTGELGIFAGSKGEQKEYCRCFGERLFGQSDFFDTTTKYTLEPLRSLGEGSLACADIGDGEIEKITLREVNIAWDPSKKDVEILKSVDLFESLRSRNRTLPAAGTDSGKIIRAQFDVKFLESQKVRKVTIRIPREARYEYDDDSGVIDAWLVERGFVIKLEKEVKPAKAKRLRKNQASLANELLETF